MIFLFIFGIIAIIVIALNIKDSSNLQKIENHFKALNCENVIYSKGVYKGFCKDEIMQIPNSFSINLEEDKKSFKFDKIKSIEVKELKIIINNDYKIEFKKKENMDTFYKVLKEKKNI